MPGFDDDAAAGEEGGEDRPVDVLRGGEGGRGGLGQERKKCVFV